MPTAGTVCGIYARNNDRRGVWKAPANETVVGSLELEYDIDHAILQALQPAGSERDPPLPGTRYRGLECSDASSDPLWKYVNVR